MFGGDVSQAGARVGSSLASLPSRVTVGVVFSRVRNQQCRRRRSADTHARRVSPTSNNMEPRATWCELGASPLLWVKVTARMDVLETFPRHVVRTLLARLVRSRSVILRLRPSAMRGIPEPNVLGHCRVRSTSRGHISQRVRRHGQRCSPGDVKVARRR